MAIRRFSTASISTGNSKSTKLWDQETFQSGMFALATVSLASNESYVDFTSIPQTYQHLQLRVFARGTTAGNTVDYSFLNFNNDSSANYARHSLRGDGSAASALGQSGAGITGIFGPLVPYSLSSTSVFGAGIIDILDYASTTKLKTVRVLSGTDANGSGSVALSSGVWLKTPIEAINQISIGYPAWGAYTHFALYGIKAG
jgi:hypothetical protein